MDKDACIFALLAARSAIDSALTMLGANERQSGCTHPPEVLENMTTMGGPERYRCRLCQEVLSG